jgi:hypothetical protein
LFSWDTILSRKCIPSIPICVVKLVTFTLMSFIYVRIISLT